PAHRVAEDDLARCIRILARHDRLTVDEHAIHADAIGFLRDHPQPGLALGKRRPHTRNAINRLLRVDPLCGDEGEIALRLHHRFIAPGAERSELGGGRNGGGIGHGSILKGTGPREAYAPWGPVSVYKTRCLQRADVLRLRSLGTLREV